MNQISNIISLNFLLLFLIVHRGATINPQQKLESARKTGEEQSSTNSTAISDNDNSTKLVRSDSSMNFLTAIYLYKSDTSSTRDLEKFNLTENEYQNIKNFNIITCFRLQESSRNKHNNFTQHLVFKTPQLPLHAVFVSGYLRFYKEKKLDTNGTDGFFYILIHEKENLRHNVIDNHFVQLYGIKNNYVGWISLDISDRITDWITTGTNHSFYVSIQRIPTTINNIDDVEITLVDKGDGKQPFILAFFHRYGENMANR